MNCTITLTDEQIASLRELLRSEEQKQIRDLRRWLKLLTRSVAAFIALTDTELVKPATYDRGKRIANWLNDLEFDNDQVKHFGLGDKLNKK